MTADSVAAVETRTPPPRRADTITDERRHEILMAARQVFLEEGFGNATMLAVARRARASKETLYGLYGSKEKLFAAIVNEACSSLNGALICPHACNPREALTHYSQRLLQLVMSPDSVALVRVAMAEAPRFPELGRLLVEQGFAPTRTVLAKYLETAVGRGELAIPDLPQAVLQFTSLLKGDFFLWRLLEAVEPPDEAWIAERSEKAIDAFLHLYEVKPA